MSSIWIDVEVYGDLGRYMPDRKPKLRLTLERSTKVTTLLGSLGLKLGEVWVNVVNGEIVDGHYELQEGDHLQVIPPIAGG